MDKKNIELFETNDYRVDVYSEDLHKHNYGYWQLGVGMFGRTIFTKNILPYPENITVFFEIKMLVEKWVTDFEFKIYSHNLAVQDCSEVRFIFHEKIITLDTPRLVSVGNTATLRDFSIKISWPKNLLDLVSGIWFEV